MNYDDIFRILRTQQPNILFSCEALYSGLRDGLKLVLEIVD